MTILYDAPRHDVRGFVLTVEILCGQCREIVKTNPITFPGQIRHLDLTDVTFDCPKCGYPIKL